MVERCEDCRFWLETAENPNVGFCRRHPPALHIVADGHEEVRTVVVMPGGWCGEWQTRDPHDFDATARRLALAVLSGDGVAARALADKVREA
jgi:hypothetical protein